MNLFFIILFLHIICTIFQICALLGTLEMQDSAKHKGHFALVNCLGAWSYQIQQCTAGLLQSIQVSCGDSEVSWQDIVMIRQQGIDNGAFVVAPDTVSVCLVC